MNIVKGLPVSSWVYITKAEDVDGCWLAQIFEFSVMSMGDSPEHALAMAREVLAITLCDDLNEGLDPNKRRAPEEEWAPLLDMISNHKAKVPVAGMNKQNSFKRFAAQVSVVLKLEEQPDLGTVFLAA